jgi:fructuronate reductase
MISRRLSRGSVLQLAPNVAVPRYDRSRMTAGIVHLGVGGFNRAHQAVLTDDCLGAGEVGWGIVGASLRSADVRDALAPQDYLYALALRDNVGEKLRVIGAIQQILVAPQDPEALIAHLAAPSTRVVSLTITEKGYTTALTTGEVIWDHPDIVHDLSRTELPRSALGLLTEGLRRRREAEIAPFTVLSCDNLPRNGQILHRSLAAFARRLDRSLGDYIADAVSCPSTMVDRIVPATTDLDRQSISQALGVEDAWPVVAEPFFQWVIEDRFPLGRPRWERSGAEFVSDIAPFENMKLRLLNGAHSAIAAIGRLAGFDTVADAMSDPRVSRFVQAFWNEVIPTLSGGIDAEDYTRRLSVRFHNTALRHRTAQIASDASRKIPQRILVPLRERRARGAPCPAMTFAIAAWIRSCAEYDENGARMTLVDPCLEKWSGKPDQTVASVEETVRAFLSLESVFDTDFRTDIAFFGSLSEALADIRRFGVRDAIASRLGGYDKEY